MDFAPYQDQSPETTRALSPPPAPDRRSGSLSPAPRAPPPPPSFQPPPPADFDTGTIPFLTLQLEATLAYLLLPPAAGVLLLLVEHRSDYVRFHAWQSALLFSAVFVSCCTTMLWGRGESAVCGLMEGCGGCRSCIWSFRGRAS
jgi:hypothetical protein